MEPRKDGRLPGGRGVSIIPLQHHGIWLVCGDFILSLLHFIIFNGY